mmetsp:Transcript_35138/g.51670  ORF Transcript_35138/g.51670 Transcript_35138/m.51670 type:complete len:241 (-) Transcript_35138:163-885(-)
MDHADDYNENGIFVYTGGRVPRHLRAHMTHAIIDNSVSVIDQYAFQDCQRLLNVDMVEFGDELERIEHMAFDNCNSLIRIAMPLDCVIDTNAFWECPMLIAIDVVGVIRKSISSLHMECWRNEMEEEINRINKELSFTETTLSSASTEEKPQVIEQWIQTVLRRFEDYRTRHYIVVKEAMTLLELALWKAKLDGSQEEDYLKEPKTKRAKIDTDNSRQERRVTCGANIIIKNVLPFLELK